ncbi:MAG TPA: glycoside hydrolase family 18 protein [Acidobacteriaceae bacterium]|nr:glycoside hydrolase family 18 protein [Acidobacteriaceae bacterium]
MRSFLRLHSIREHCLWTWIVLFVCTVPALARHNPERSHGESRPAIVAYIFPRDHVIAPGEIAAEKVSRINYAFANIQDGRIVAVSPADAPNFATLVALKQQNPSLQVLVSVGGWLWSGNFSDAALTRESRSLFVDSVVAFLEEYKLDGLDIDWEYPGQTGAGNKFRPEDKQNYTLLLMELRRRFNREQAKMGHPLLLTVAAGASTEFLDHTEMGRVARAVDTVNLMAYDYYEPGSEPTTGNHAPLYRDPADPEGVAADVSVSEFERAGVPARKLVLGVPFYGHVWGKVDATNHGLFQPGSAVPNAYSRYQDIGNLLSQGFTRYWDAPASVPYLYSDEKKEFVSYEDPESLALKCAYVLKHKLGGMMFWEYSADPSGALLDTIDKGLWSGSQSTTETSR